MLWFFVAIVIIGAVAGVILEERRKKQIKQEEQEKQAAALKREQRRMEEMHALEKKAEESLMAFIRTIPAETLSLLWIGDGPLKNIDRQNTAKASNQFFTVRFEMQDEPSTIYTCLPLETYDIGETVDVPYYPSYQGITPKARLKYLKWLTDITQPVDIGFVFIFYYGLERHLFAGRHEEAAEMILKLREYHKNSSFQSYSEDALTIYAVKRRRIDIANRIGIIEFGKKAIIAAATHGRIEPYDIIMNARKFGFTNTRYIKMYPELFEETLARGLQEKYGSPAMHIDQDDIMGSPRTGVMVLANYSLQSKNKMINYPNILENENFKTDVLSALLNTHEQVKDELARRRKGAVKQED